MKTARRLRNTVCGGFGALCLVATAPAMPSAGRYEGRLCVATSNAAPDCGPADVVLQPGGLASVRISDIEYRLQLRGGATVDVVLMHGTMQIDGFSAPYAWQGSALQFSDDEKHVRYEVRVGDRKPAGR